MEKFKFIPKDKISALPKAAGVYAFFDGRKILYIGKAINIRKRVKNHFQQPGFLNQAVLNQVKHIAYIETGSEIEALILEANLIKKYQPKYNVVWKDDKNYFYVGITKDPLPRVSIVHQTDEKCSRYIGPFVDGNALKQTLKILRRTFPYYTQRKHPDKLCPWCHLELCPGPNPDRKEYKKNIKNLIAVLNGKRKSVLKSLKKEMELASKRESFERAANLRNQFFALENVASHAKILQPETVPQTSLWYQKRIEAYDVSNIQGKLATGSMVTFINGKPDKNFYRRFKIKIEGKPNDIAMIKEILSRRFNHPEWPYPQLILIDGGKAQLNIAIKTRNQKPETRKIKVAALAKEKNELYGENRKKSIRLDSLPNSQKFVLLQLRDEAHRFAISYHRKLRIKNLA